MLAGFRVKFEIKSWEADKAGKVVQSHESVSISVEHVENQFGAFVKGHADDFFSRFGSGTFSMSQFLHSLLQENEVI